MTLVEEADFAHDVDYFAAFYTEGDAEGFRAILFLACTEEFEVV